MTGLLPAGNSRASRNRGLGVVPGWLLSTAAGCAEGSDPAERGGWFEGRDGEVASVLAEVVDEVDGQIGAADGGVAGGCVVHLLAQGGVGRDGESGDLQVPPGHVVDCLFSAPGRGEPERAAWVVGMSSWIARRVNAGGSRDKGPQQLTGPLDEQLLMGAAGRHGGGKAAELQSNVGGHARSGGEFAEHLAHGRQPASQAFEAPALDIQVAAADTPSGPADLVADQPQRGFGFAGG